MVAVQVTHQEHALYWEKQRVDGEENKVALKGQLAESRQSVASLEREVATLNSTMERSAALAQEDISSYQQRLCQLDASLLRAKVEPTNTAHRSCALNSRVLPDDPEIMHTCIIMV